MKFYSISEISEKLDIPKGKIYYKIRTDENFKILFKKDLKTGSYVLNYNDIEIVANTFNIPIDSDKIYEKEYEKKIKSGLEYDLGNINNRTITLLEEEIEFLKSQLIEKDLQISKLLQISQNNQVLLLEEKKLDSNSNISDSIFDKIVKFFKRK